MQSMSPNEEYEEDEDTEEEEYLLQPKNSFYKLAMESLENAVDMVSKHFNELNLIELANVAKKFIIDKASAAKLPQLSPEKILLQTADTEPNLLEKVRSILKENQYLQRSLWTVINGAYKKALKNKEYAVKLFQSNIFILIPTLLLKEIFDKYATEEDFEKFVGRQLKIFGLSLESMKRKRENYKKGLICSEKALELLNSSRLELDLAPRHVARLIINYCKNINRINNRIYIERLVQRFSKMDFYFFLAMINNKRMLVILNCKIVFDMQMFHINTFVYKKTLTEDKIAQYGFISATINRAFRDNDENIVDEFLRIRNTNKNLQEILALEAKNFLSLKDYALQTLFQNSYLPFNCKQIAKLLNKFCSNDVFFSMIVVWIANNKELLEPSFDDKIVTVTLKNEALASKVLSGMMSTLLSEQALEEIRNKYPDFETKFILPPIVSDITYWELNNDEMIPKDLKFREKIIAAKAGMFDYLAIRQDGAVVFLEERNQRETQEDGIDIGSIPHFADLDAEAQYLAILTTFEELQAKYGQRPIEGACALVIIFTPLGIFIINLGDCYAFLIKISGQKIVTTQLNEVLHKPNIPEEQKRLQEFHQKFQGDPDAWRQYVTPDCSRLKSSFENGQVDPSGFQLSLTRAFGDTAHKRSGFKHIPDIYFTPYDIENTDKAYLIISCDGLMENSGDIKWIGSRVAANSEELPEIIANVLARQAKENLSRDNISLIVIDLKKLLKQVQSQQNESQYFLICDGHGSGRVTGDICQHFAETLCAKVNQMREEATRHEKRPRKENSSQEQEKENENENPEKNKRRRVEEPIENKCSDKNPSVNPYSKWTSKNPIKKEENRKEEEEKENEEEEEGEEDFKLARGFEKNKCGP